MKNYIFIFIMVGIAMLAIPTTCEAKANNDYFGKQLVKGSIASTVYLKCKKNISPNTKNNSVIIKLKNKSAWYDTSEEATKAVREKIMGGANAFLRDHPTQSWLCHYPSLEYKFIHKNGMVRVKNIKVTFTTYYADSGNLDIQKNLKRAVKQIKKKLPKRTSKRQKYLAIQKYITKRVPSYSNDNILTKCGASVFLGNHAMNCQGYSRLYKILCDEMDLPCVIVFGDTDKGDAHMWVVVKIKKKWYGIDPCWNTALPARPYFLASSKNKLFTSQHLPTTEYFYIGSDNVLNLKYPKLAKY